MLRHYTPAGIPTLANFLEDGFIYGGDIDLYDYVALHGGFNINFKIDAVSQLIFRGEEAIHSVAYNDQEGELIYQIMRNYNAVICNVSGFGIHVLDSVSFIRKKMFSSVLCHFTRSSKCYNQLMQQAIAENDRGLKRDLKDMFEVAYYGIGVSAGGLVEGFNIIIDNIKYYDFEDIFKL